MKQKKVALITGGVSGIGLATSRLLALKDWVVIQADLNAKPEKGSVNLLEYQCDVGSSSGDMALLIDYMERKFGRLDFLLANAGIHLAKPVEKTTDAEFDRLMRFNNLGVFYSIRTAVPLMEKNGGGCIVTVSSDAGLIPDRDAVLYSASKHWIVGLSKGLSLTLIKKGIRVNCICPGATDTPFLHKAFGYDQTAIDGAGLANPLGRLLRPEEVAEVIVFMLEHEGVNGAVWNMDGGYSWNAAGEPPKKA